MCILPNSFTTIFTCSCVTLEASKSRNLLRRSEIACLLKLPLNSCNFSFSHFFIFTMCSVFSKAFISLSLSSKTLLSKVITIVTWMYYCSFICVWFIYQNVSNF
jgi:hypothetical protein